LVFGKLEHRKSHLKAVIKIGILPHAVKLTKSPGETILFIALWYSKGLWFFPLC